MKLEEYVRKNVEHYFELGVSLVEAINIFVYKLTFKREDLEKRDLIISLCVEIYQKYKNSFQRKECSNFCEGIVEDTQKFELENGYNLLCRDILVESGDVYYGDYDYHIYRFGLEDEKGGLVVPIIYEKINEENDKIQFINKSDTLIFYIHDKKLENKVSRRKKL